LANDGFVEEENRLGGIEMGNGLDKEGEGRLAVRSMRRGRDGVERRLQGVVNWEG
jgi:hypothetical protein